MKTELLEWITGVPLISITGTHFVFMSMSGVYLGSVKSSCLAIAYLKSLLRILSLNRQIPMENIVVYDADNCHGRRGIKIKLDKDLFL